MKNILTGLLCLTGLVLFVILAVRAWDLEDAARARKMEEWRLR